MECVETSNKKQQNVVPVNGMVQSSALTITKRRNSKDSCRKRKRSMKRSLVYYKEPYEVERIISHQISNGRVIKYFVKWKNYPSETNTWEPLENLRDCTESLADYYHNLVYPNMKPVHYTSKITALKASLSQFSDVEIADAARKYFTDKGDIIPKVNEKRIEDLVTAMAKIPRLAQDQAVLNQIRIGYLHKKLKALRDEQMNNLKQWENDVKTVCDEKATINIFNSVDLEGPPSNFSYVNSYISGPDVVIPTEPPFGCDCTSCFPKNCRNIHGEIFYKDGLIKVPRGTPIYECNKTCKCESNCPNRIIQHGRTIPVAIFRTSNGCGWGLRTLAKIQKGQFVVEYVGEVITTEEAERRGRYYDKEGCTYLFDLDFNDKNNFPYTVDAGSYGNVSHFINHCCNPNLEVYAVWVNCLDPNLPRLALYAARTIHENEELTFDYLCQPENGIIKKKGSNNNKTAVEPNSNEEKAKNLNPKLLLANLCKCGTKDCRKFLFFN